MNSRRSKSGLIGEFYYLTGMIILARKNIENTQMEFTQKNFSYIGMSFR